MQLKPNSSQILQTSDQLIVIAQDQASIHLSSLKPEIDPEAIVQANGAIAQPEKTLILGWNRHGTAIINELDGYVATGSSLTVMSEVDAQADISSACTQLKNQTLTVQTGDTTDRRNLISLEPTKFDHVIVLAYSDTLTAKRADAKTLVTLLHLRELKTQKNATLGIVSEMLDARNRELAEVTQADDFIVSERLVSLMVAQLSNDWERAAVFSDLFSSEGAELYLKPISDYVKPGLKLDFYTVLEAAKARGELAIGYRLAAISRDSSQNYGVSINPVKTKMLSFSRDDKIIVLA